MQSILAYRRFGKRVDQQYKRHTEGQFSPNQVSPNGGQQDAERGFPIAESESSTIVDNRIDENDVTNGAEHTLATQRITPERTKTSESLRLGYTLTGVNVNTHDGKKVLVVGYEGDNDDMNPHNWSLSRRILATLMVASIGWIVGFASSIDSAVSTGAAAEFGVSDITEALATGLYLIAFGIGAFSAGPFSEAVGRNPVYLGTFSLYMVFVMASALAPNIGAQLAFRFLAGLFASTPLTTAGGSISDLWDPLERTLAFPLFSVCAFSGPIFGPVVGGWIAQSLDWRWADWITLIISAVVYVAIILFQPETYAPILLKWKAQHLRRITGDQRFKAEIEIREQTFITRMGVALYRPFVVTVREPIVALIALYLTVIYIILFTFLQGYDYIFKETYGLSSGLTGTCFLGIGVGLCIAFCCAPLIYRVAKKKTHELREKGDDTARIPPEFRLWYAMAGAPAIPISLFWMGWTAYPSISIWSPLLASVLNGFGLLCIFISSYQYIIDTYETYAASALASATLFRYVAAGAMVEAAIPMYESLGVHWTCTLLGCVSALLVPVPYLFYRYGERIRKGSRYAVV